MNTHIIYRILFVFSFLSFFLVFGKVKWWLFYCIACDNTIYVFGGGLNMSLIKMETERCVLQERR